MQIIVHQTIFGSTYLFMGILSPYNLTFAQHLILAVQQISNLFGSSVITQPFDL
jgi:hypothetical protein